MTRAVALALFIVIGLSVQARSDSSARDDLNIEAVGTSEAVVTYHNHAAGFSRNGMQRRSVDIGGGQTISVDVEIEVGAGPGGAELATVCFRCIEIAPRGVMRARRLRVVNYPIGLSSRPVSYGWRGFLLLGLFVDDCVGQNQADLFGFLGGRQTNATAQIGPREIKS